MPNFDPFQLSTTFRHLFNLIILDRLETRYMQIKKSLIILFILFIAVSACSPGWVQRDIAAVDEAQYEPYWPTKGWRTSPAEAQGVNSDRLSEMFAYIDEQRVDIDSVVVIRNGYIIAEQYYPPYSQDDPHVLYSCTKSFMSALVGIAIAEGKIEGVEETVIGLFPEKQFNNLDARKSEMILEDLLTMRSGLAWVEGWPAYQGLATSLDAISYVVDMEMSDTPGESFNYCSGCSHVLSGIILETTGMNTLDFAQDRLFEPLGISNVNWETDRSGIPIGGWGLFLTPRDMAKFGYLYLHNGLWDGHQIVPEVWVSTSVEPGRNVEPGVDYAYQWWVYPEQSLFAAQGLEGQKIIVIPNLDMVVVFTADLKNTDIEWDLVENWIIPAAMP
jgi:CubicO group peptidase (beta-lactamase class C family)